MFPPPGLEPLVQEARYIEYSLVENRAEHLDVLRLHVVDAVLDDLVLQSAALDHDDQSAGGFGQVRQIHGLENRRAIHDRDEELLAKIEQKVGDA